MERIRMKLKSCVSVAANYTVFAMMCQFTKTVGLNPVLYFYR